MDGGRDRRLAIAAVGLVIVFAAWSRWPTIDEGLWADEILTVYLARSHSLRELIARCRVADYSPPLFHLILAGWGRLFGFGEVAVKSLVFTLGLAGIGTGALAAGEMFGPVAAAIAAVLLANNWLTISMSSEVRPYVLSGALAGLSLFALFRLYRLSRDGRKTAMAQVGATSALVAFGYSHYFGMLSAAIIGAFALLLAVVGTERGSWTRVAASAAIAGLTYLPWLPIFLYQRSVGLPWSPHFTAPILWARFVTKINESLPIISDGATSGSWLGVAILLILIARSTQARAVLRERSRALGLCGILGLLCYFFVAYAAPASRYLTVGVVFSSLFAAGLLSAATSVSSGRSRGAAWLGIGLIVAGSFLGNSWHYEQIRHFREIGLAKSGIRTAFERNRFGASDVLIAIPDAQSQSLWFYSRSSSLIRGFPRWNDPVMPDYEHYDRDWTDPNAIGNAWAALRQDIRERDAKRVVLFNSAGEFALSAGCARDFDDFLHARLPVVKESAYAGTIEGTRLTIFSVPENLREGADTGN